MTKYIGEYEIRYDDSEFIGVAPEIFFESSTNNPIIDLPAFFLPNETDYLYREAISNFHLRVFATVHDYSSGAEGAKVDTNGRFTHYIPVSNEAYNFLNQKLNESIFPLIKETYKISGTLKQKEGWQFLGYGEGFFFRNHCDNCVPGSVSTNPVHHNQTWWCNSTTRKFTVLIYLNDQCQDYAPTGTYSGGDLTLNKIFKNNKVYRIKPTAGTLVVFPSNPMFNHEVHNVTRGYRFCIVTWIDLE